MVVKHNDPDCLCLGELINVEITVAGDTLPILAMTLLLSMALVSIPLKGEILDVMKKQLSSLDARPCIRFGSQNRASAGEMRIGLVAHILGSLSTSNEVFSINNYLITPSSFHSLTYDRNSPTPLKNCV